MGRVAEKVAVFELVGGTRSERSSSEGKQTRHSCDVWVRRREGEGREGCLEAAL